MVNTVTVKRANVELTVDAAQKDYYLGQGYAVIDASTGDVIEDSTVQTVESLNRRVAELQDLLEQKDAEIQKLKKQQLKERKSKD